MPGLARGLISQVVDPHTPDRQKKPIRPMIVYKDEDGDEVL